MINKLFRLSISLIVCCFILLFQLFYTYTTAHAYYEENFDGGFNDPSLWMVDRANQPLFSSTSMNLSAPYGRSFTYIRSSSQIIGSSDNVVEVKLRYSQAGGDFGAGFAITDVNPPLNTVMFYPSVFAQYTMFYVWQGPATPHFHIVTFLCPLSNPQCGGTPTVIYQTSSQDLSDHIIKVIRNGSSYSLLLDGLDLFDSAPTTRTASNIWFGHPEITNTSGSWASLSIDYLKIGDPSSTPTPTPSPTTTPTPVPSTFPYFTQKDPSWASHEYDSATSWAGIDKSGIDRWGCALTSTAMELQHFGVKMTDGNNINPDNLNTWLKSQNDGYVGSGFLNWLAVTRLAHQSYLAHQSPTELEFIQQKGNVTPILPAILGLGGHFIVAHGEDTLGNWKINDPAIQSSNTLPKTTILASVNRFIPSHTNLSYMLFVSDPNVDINIPGGVEYIESISDDTNTSNPGITKKFIYVQQPAEGTYALHIDSHLTELSGVEAYLYDEAGSVTKDVLSIPPLSKADFKIQYSPDQNESTVVVLDYTSIFNYIKQLRVGKTPANGIFQALYSRFTDLLTNQSGINDLSRFIVKQSPKNITPDTKVQLQNYIMLIKEN